MGGVFARKPGDGGGPPKPNKKALFNAFLPTTPAAFAAALALAPKPIAAARAFDDTDPSNSNGCSAPSVFCLLALMLSSQHLCLAVPSAAQFLALAGPFFLFTASLHSCASFRRASSSAPVTSTII